MMKKKQATSRHKDIAKRLRDYRSQYDRIKSQLNEVGFICKGSLVERRLPCGTPGCVCHKDPTKRHGPYYQLSLKQKGKTVSRFVSAQEAHLYQEWIENRRMLTAIIEQMHGVSQKAAKHMIDRPETTKRSAKKSP